MQDFVALAQTERTPEVVNQAMDTNRQLYRRMIEEGCFQNQIAVDLFKSSRTPEMGLIKENNRYLYRDVNYIKDKKLKTIYLDQTIKTTGYSPVELLINQTNKYWEQSQLESRPIIQFQDLFKDVEFTPQQRFAAVAAKYEFDQIYNAAVRMEIRRETERGPSAVIQTTQGAKIEVANLTRYGHPSIWKAQTINLKLESAPTYDRGHTLLALAQINNELTEDGKPAYRKLGTVSQQSVKDNNLKPGMATSNAKLVELKPELSRSQTKLMFDKAHEVAQSYRDSIPPEQRLSAAAAAWVVGAARQDELENRANDKSNQKEVDEDTPQREIQKKIPNFVFAAFGDEIVERLDQMQFTDLTLGTLSEESNNFRGQQWNPQEKYPIEIRASHHPAGNKRHGLRLAFVADTDGQYKEYAALEPRTGQLPIGTKALAHIVSGETYTAKATIKVPGKQEVNFTIREMSKFTYAGRVFNAENVTIEIGTKLVPSQTVKIQLDGKTLGELDADSIKQLQAFNKLKDGQSLNLKLKTISHSQKLGFVLASSPNGNLLKINNIGQYDYKGQTFDDKDYRNLTLQISQTVQKDAVFLNGQPLGVLFYNKDKEALKEIGALKPGKLTSVQATIQSNFSTSVLKIDPATVQYPQTWTKESQAFSTKQPPQKQQQMEVIAQMLALIKERPTILFASAEDRELGRTRMAVDNHKFEAVEQWLRQKNISFTKLAPENVPTETKKGLSVFNLVNDSIPEPIWRSMTSKFGAVEAFDQYQAKLRSLPTRPNQEQLSQPTSDSTSKPEVQQQSAALVTINDLQDWYNNAQKLGKPESYLTRILEVTNQFQDGQPLSDNAFSAMQQDKTQLEQLGRLTEMAQRIGAVWGRTEGNGSTVVRGKVYDLTYKSDTKDLAISLKNGDIVLSVQCGQVKINKVTPEIFQTFEQANNQAMTALANTKKPQIEIHN